MTGPPLWILDQVQNDGRHAPILWIPAYAGMTVRDAVNDGTAAVDCGSSPE